MSHFFFSHPNICHEIKNCGPIKKYHQQKKKIKPYETEKKSEAKIKPGIDVEKKN